MNLYGFCGGNPVNESDPNGTTFEDAVDAVTKHRSDIIHVANAFGIQPDLLAGVVWNEMQPGGILPNWNGINRSLSIPLLPIRHHASFGATQVTKWDRPHKDVITGKMLPADVSGSRDAEIAWAKAYDGNFHQNLIDSARFLQRLASRSNRYPNNWGNLSKQQMSIVLSEYNQQPKNEPANQAKPSPYGQRFLRDYTLIDDYMRYPR